MRMDLRKQWRNRSRRQEQVVLLIDEIDKADLEFPNDLLWELDQMEFYIYETKETIKAKVRPIVIITSNAEKEQLALPSKPVIQLNAGLKNRCSTYIRVYMTLFNQDQE